MTTKTTPSGPVGEGRACDARVISNECSVFANPSCWPDRRRLVFDFLNKAMAQEPQPNKTPIVPPKAHPKVTGNPPVQGGNLSEDLLNTAMQAPSPLPKHMLVGKLEDVIVPNGWDKQDTYEAGEMVKTKGAKSDKGLTREDEKLRDAITAKYEQYIVGTVVDQGSLVPLGSSMNGFGAKGSDLDLTLLTPLEGIKTKEFIQQVGDLLAVHPDVTELEIVNARIPIVAFIDKPTGLEVDLCVNNYMGILNTYMLRTYANMHPVVKETVLLIKEWAKARGTSGAPRMMLSSYALTLLVLRQCIELGVVPNLTASRPKNGESYLFHVDFDALLARPAYASPIDVYSTDAMKTKSNVLVGAKQLPLFEVIRKEKGILRHVLRDGDQEYSPFFKLHVAERRPNVRDALVIIHSLFVNLLQTAPYTTMRGFAQVRGKPKKRPRQNPCFSLIDPFEPKHNLSGVFGRDPTTYLLFRREMARAVKLMDAGYSFLDVVCRPCKVVDSDGTQRTQGYPANLFEILRGNGRAETDDAEHEEDLMDFEDEEEEHGSDTAEAEVDAKGEPAYDDISTQAQDIPTQAQEVMLVDLS